MVGSKVRKMRDRGLRISVQPKIISKGFVKSFLDLSIAMPVIAPSIIKAPMSQINESHLANKVTKFFYIPSSLERSPIQFIQIIKDAFKISNN